MKTQHKISVNKTMKLSDKNVTWFYFADQDSKKLARKVSKELNKEGFVSRVSSFTGDTFRVFTKDLVLAYQRVLSNYPNLFAFDYNDGTIMDVSLIKN